MSVRLPLGAIWAGARRALQGARKTICGGFAKQLLADRVLTTILEAQEEIYADIKSHQPKSDALNAAEEFVQR